MIISGNLDETSIVDTFQLIGSSRKTGILRASQKDGEIRIYWKSGSIVYAESHRNGSALHERLGALVGTEVWHRTMREANNSIGLAGQRLMGGGLIQPARLKSMAEAASRAAIEELFSWSEGGFEFTEGPFPDGDFIPVPLHTPSLIVEGSRRVQQRAQLRQVIPDKHSVFRLAALPDASLTAIRLGSEEWAMLSLINGQRTIEEVIRLSGGEELRSLQALYGLVSAGLIVEIEPVDDDDSGKLELGKVKYSRILEVYCELHTMLMDRLLEAPPAIGLPPLAAACAKLAKTYPKVWASVPIEPHRELPGAQFLANLLKLPADQRMSQMMQSFGHLLLKEVLVIRHVLGDDAARGAITDVRMVLQLGPKRYPEVSSKILRHVRDVLRQSETIPSRYKMAFDFFETHRYDEAIRLWKSIPICNPQYPAAQELIAQAHRLTIGRSQLRLALERGEHLYGEGRYKEAMEIWQEALKVEPEAQDPDHETTKKTLLKRVEEMTRVSALLAEARTLFKDRRYDDARRVLEQASHIAPDLPEVVELVQEVNAKADKVAMVRELVFQGLEKYRSEQYPEAIETFRRVLSFDSRHQLAGDHMRFSHDRLMARVRATPRYAQALQASRVGDHSQAVELWEGLLQSDPNDSIAAFLMREERAVLQAQRLYHEAKTFYLDANLPRAIELLERCLEEHPGHVDAKSLLDQARVRLTQVEKADGLLAEAEQLFQAGKLAEAKRAVERLLELDPQHRKARLARNQVLQAMEEESSTGTYKTASSLIAPMADDRATGTIRIVAETAPSQLFEELMAEDTMPSVEATTPTLTGQTSASEVTNPTLTGLDGPGRTEETSAGPSDLTKPTWAEVPPKRPASPAARPASPASPPTSQRVRPQMDESPTPDLRDMAKEVRKRLLDDDATRPFPPNVL